MPRYDYKKLKYDEQEKLLHLLAKVLEKMKNKKDIADFLKDILNRSERLMVVRRLLIASMLEKKKTYDEIQEKLKVGRATIARTERWLNFGRGGFKKAVKIITQLKKKK